MSFCFSGATALHFAAETGNLKVVQMLVELGKASTMVKNRYGLIPIMAAAERCQTAVFDYLFSQCSDVLTKEEEIDSLELLGASFANDKDNNNIEKCYEYLEMAMKLRWQDADNPIKKKGLQVSNAQNEKRDIHSYY